ncbi:uncharacterized protein BDW70DRAFT_144580, partial [Aspergillus foveolatus]|uniref:uncharacterized protein n=1 Tax=Aspergillus foveolatus TaxID=210207 RepID=UPI003CCD9BE7
MSYLLCRIFLLAPDAAPAAERQRWVGLNRSSFLDSQFQDFESFHPFAAQLCSPLKFSRPEQDKRGAAKPKPYI